MSSTHQLSGKTLSDARSLLKLTQKEVAELAGISVSTVRRLERGERASDYAVGRLGEALKREGAVFVASRNETDQAG